ncbi:MAG: hypothetical protein JXB10_00905 [Pirellulales bacterium]|nr:hypothetical protein [Pirellulales bacterium]
MGKLKWKEEERKLIERAMAEMEAKNTAVDAIVHFDEVTWNVDQDAGTIVFQRPDGMKAIAPVQIIGTYNKKYGTWLWTWDNPSVLKSLARCATVVAKYGEEHKIPSLTTRKISCDESDCLKLTALACKLSDMQGTYCGRIDGTWVYMTFGIIRLQRWK